MAVHLLAGPVGSGKTTYARQLEDRGAVRFSTDEWMIRLYGQHLPPDVRQLRAGVCRRLFLDMAREIAAVGVDVVLDCGFSRRDERDEARQRLVSAGLPVELIHFDVPRDERWRRIALRNQQRPFDSYALTRPMFDELDGRFEPPAPEERARLHQG
jgi:predicted kinase